ncbi:MAG: hypothetical protein C3F11_17780 [Methylocystaceae bacterium]|nr:MAG: hypothetical protein C3F11_17780 [Methylocystaceae bacterium]
MSSNWWKIALSAASAALSPAPRAGAADRPSLACFPTAETRQLIVDRRLADPFATMQAASAAAHGEPIGAKLCRADEELVYEISLLRRDGRVVRIYVDAATGKPHPGR